MPAPGFVPGSLDVNAAAVREQQRRASTRQSRAPYPTGRGDDNGAGAARPARLQPRRGSTQYVDRTEVGAELPEGAGVSAPVRLPARSPNRTSAAPRPSGAATSRDVTPAQQEAALSDLANDTCSTSRRRTSDGQRLTVGFTDLPPPHSGAQSAAGHSASEATPASAKPRRRPKAPAADEAVAEAVSSAQIRSNRVRI